MSALCDLMFLMRFISLSENRCFVCALIFLSLLLKNKPALFAGNKNFK